MHWGSCAGHLRILFRGVWRVTRPLRRHPDMMSSKESGTPGRDARIYWISFPSDLAMSRGAVDPEDGVSGARHSSSGSWYGYSKRRIARRPRDVSRSRRVCLPVLPAPWSLHCQPNRLRKGIARIGFYTAKAIQEEVPAILFRRDSVEISQEAAVAFAGSDDPPERAAGETLVSAIDSGDLGVGWEGQVFLLSAPDDDRTLTLHHPIAHRERGAWTQKQRYVASDILRAEPTTTEELGK